LSDRLLGALNGRHRALVRATESGVLAGTALLAPDAGVPAGRWTALVPDGTPVQPGQPLVDVSGSAVELAAAEDYVMGALGYASGIATRARQVAGAAPGGLRVVCGAWKKLPAALKPLLRAGLAAAGVAPRLLDGAFVYVDKNVVRLLGGIDPAVAGARSLHHGPVAVQVENAGQAVSAARGGARAVVVDTGSLADLAAADAALRVAGLRADIVLAFAGGVTTETLVGAHAAGADVVDVGRAILNAPLLDLRFEVIEERAFP
jgi:nicotinate-nucleotide pyrophosphorylase (carboxylating)